MLPVKNVLINDFLFNIGGENDNLNDDVDFNISLSEDLLDNNNLYDEN